MPANKIHRFTDAFQPAAARRRRRFRASARLTAAGLAAQIAAAWLCAGMLMALGRQLAAVGFGAGIHPALPMGAGAYLAMHWLLFRPTLAYVFAHEMTHALWSLLFGGRLRELRVGPGGGQVRLTRVNLLVVLAPYFFPLHVYMLLALYRLMLYCGASRPVLPAACFQPPSSLPSIAYSPVWPSSCWRRTRSISAALWSSPLPGPRGCSRPRCVEGKGIFHAANDFIRSAK